MEPYLITLTIALRVEPTADQVVRATTNAQTGKWRLLVLGTKGSRRYLQGPQVATFATNEQYMRAAQAGLLYVEAEEHVSKRMAFSPDLDKATGLPVLLERFEHAFAKRQPDGQVPEQAKITQP